MIKPLFEAFFAEELAGPIAAAYVFNPPSGLCGGAVEV
jgi:hypothetical protein